MLGNLVSRVAAPSSGAGEIRQAGQTNRAMMVIPAGVEERAPKTDDEWQSVEANARILADAAKLMIVSPRHHGDREWIVLSTALVDAATIAETAARRRDASGVFAAGEGIYATCDGCHRKYPLPMRMPLPFP